MLPSSPTVDRVLKGQLCTGCGLCASVAPDSIGMEVVAPGFNRPVQGAPLPEAAEQEIARACPGRVIASWEGAPNIHPYWGPWRAVGTGYATDPRVRYEGSSGGALSALAIHALETGLVDRVMHVTADPEHPTRNIMLCSTSPEQVLLGAGSRYAPSSPLAQINQALSDGGSIAFIGKPCDVSALRRLGQGDERVARHVPLMLSFFCGGLPSHRGAERILAAMGVAPDQLASFRYRGRGWPGTAAATAHDGRVAEMSYAQSWGGHLSKEVQFRCKICADPVGGVADIACADAWYGGDDGYPSFEEEDGRSLIVTRTVVGEDLLRSAVAAKALDVQDLPIDEIDAMQPSQARRKRLVAARLAALTVAMQPRPDMDGACVREAARRGGRVEQAKNFAGTLRRLVRGDR